VEPAEWREVGDIPEIYRIMRRDPVFPTPPLPPKALQGCTIVITGASDGIGFALSRRCAEAGGQVIMVGRNRAKTDHAVSRIKTTTGSRLVFAEIADLLYLEEQDALVHRLLQRGTPLHALVNNAGALFLEWELTRDGLERTFALNHLAYVRVSSGLLPALRAAASPGTPARLLNVASRAHMGARFALDNLQGERHYSGWSAYAASKLYNILFTRALAKRVAPHELSVHALHPGLVASRFAANNGWKGRAQRRVMDWFSVSVEAGSDTAAWLLACNDATDASGSYWVQRAVTTPSRDARSNAFADALWKESERLVKTPTP
jgi:NAD(P)-dependent dehydrogenase (short-subunit alcohol dehydrogenase family)